MTTALAEPRTVTGIGPRDDADVHVALSYYPFDVSVSRWGTAKWDVSGGALWEGPPPEDDISCDVMSVSIVNGRDQPLDRFRTATCTVVLYDPAGSYSPWTSAPVAGTFGAIRPGIMVRVWIETAGGIIPRFVGTVDSITDNWTVASNEPDTPHLVTFRAVDGLADLAAYNGTEQAPAGAGELSGARIGRIATNALYNGARAIDAGTVTCQATTLAKNALEEAGLTADTERGALWVDPAGVLQYRDRNGLVTEPNYVTVQAVFGDEPGEICYTALQPASDAAKVRNLVTIARAGGTAVTVSDDQSIALYKAKTYRRLDLIHENDVDSTTIANEYLDAFAFAANRVERLSVDVSAMPDAQLDTVLALDLLHLIEVRRRAVGFQIVAQLQIEGTAEEITADKWTLSYRTFGAAFVFAPGRWNVAQWDTGLWGY